MHFKDKLKTCSKADIWQEYCGFLELSIEEYMQIQFRLLKEQIQVYAASGLGRRLFNGKTPETVEEFREQIPLTTYEDYADILLEKRVDQLPSVPVVWLETTWESGSSPIKTAPYSEEMLEVYRNNILAAMILSTSDQKGQFHIQKNPRVLYGLAPLPYATGLFPGLIAPELDVRFMPPLKKALSMSFGEQNRQGFSYAMKSGIDQFFGMSSVIYTITKNFDRFLAGGSISLKELLKIRPAMLYRLMKAKYISRRDGKPIRPADLFHLTGFVCVGTDTALFKDELEKAWGRRPLEIHGGTEPACIGTETWSRDGLVFFPDTCFYEFIPEAEMEKNLEDPSYVPRTYLMNQLAANENYELVITVLKGGAFVRYRVGDMYRCLRTKNSRDGLELPQFVYIDRVPTVIDIAGFTRVTKKTIEHVIELSRLPVAGWFARKEYDGENRCYLHLYVEFPPEEEGRVAIDSAVLKEHLSIYFRHYDQDYKDLRRLLGTDPLQVTVLPMGSIRAYEEKTGRKIKQINPGWQDVAELNALCGRGRERTGGVGT